MTFNEKLDTRDSIAELVPGDIYKKIANILSKDKDLTQDVHDPEHLSFLIQTDDIYLGGFLQNLSKFIFKNANS